MSFDFDAGAGGSEGPWLVWSARGTQDGAVPPKTFYIRDQDGKEPFDLTKGVVMDVENMRSGWQRSEGLAGVAPEWRWNASVGRMEDQPGDDWKKGIQIRCAIGGGKVATWEQAGAAAWNGFVGIVPALQAGPGDGKLPLVRLADTKLQQFKRGSTVEPVLEVVKWVPRPDCLKPDYTGFDTSEQAQEPAPAKAAPQPAPQPATVAADDEF